MTRLTVLGRLTAAAVDKRTLTGKLLPYGEVGSTNLGKVTATAGCVDVPASLRRLRASLEHPARQVGSHECATFTKVWEAADGLYAEWSVAATPAGDRLLAEHTAGTRTGISVELDPVAISDAGEITAGRLDACAFPVAPAFDSARLCAEFAPGVDLDEDRDTEALLADYSTESVTTDTYTYVDEETGEEVTVNTTRRLVEESTSTETRAGEPADDEDDEDEDDDIVTTSAPLAASRSTGPTRRADPARATAPRPVPRTDQRQRGADGTARLTASTATKADVLRLLAGAASGDKRMYAALADITETATVVANPPAWVGELWSGVAYQRRVVPLLGAAPLTNLRVKGYRWTTKPVMGSYAGDKAQIPTGPVALEEYEDKARRLAGGHDIDRAHVDFNDTEFFDAYFRAMAESYSRLSDSAACADVLAAAPATVLGPVPADIDAATSMVVDLALSIIDIGAPTFAIVAKDVYRTMLLTPADKRLAFLSQSLGMADGTVDTFRVVPFPDLEPGEAVVGTRAAVTFRELGSTPIRAEALDIAKGGTDRGCFGYYHTQVSDERGLATADLTPTP